MAPQFQAFLANDRWGIAAGPIVVANILLQNQYETGPNTSSAYGKAHAFVYAGGFSLHFRY